MRLFRAPSFSLSGVIAFAGFLLFLILLAAFFTFYCIAKNKGKEEEKGTFDAANKVRPDIVQGLYDWGVRRALGPPSALTPSLSFSSLSSHNY